MSPVPKFRSSPPILDKPTEKQFLEGSVLVGRMEEPTAAILEPQVRPAEKDTTVYRTVNVKLNKRMYTQFKMLSTLTDTSMQQHMVELIDVLLEHHKALLNRHL